MSKIVRNERITVVDETVVGIKCDVCNNEIPHREEPYYLRDKTKRYIKYAECSRRHRDWGNDSYESKEDFDVCLGCLGKWLEEAETYLKENDTGIIDVWMTTELIKTEEE